MRRPLCLFALLLPLAASAQEGNSKASLSLGYVGTTGNTETETYNLEFLYRIGFDEWTHSLKFQALGSQENSLVKAERYYLENKSDYNFSDNDYVFARATVTDDRFSGFDYQASVSTGYGHYFLNDGNRLLEAFAGAGYRHNAPVGLPDEGEVIFTVGENFEWQLGISSRLTQSLTSEIGEDLTVSKFEIGLVSTIIGSIATKIAFQARHTSKVPVETEKTDTQTSVSLVYEF